MSVESIHLNKETNPDYNFIKDMLFMKDTLKKISIQYTNLLPIQYHKFKEFQLDEFKLNFERGYIKTLDLEIIDYINEGCSLNFSQQVPIKSISEVVFSDVYFILYNKAKCKVTFLYADQIKLLIDLADKEVLTSTDDNYFYIQTLSNIQISNLKKSLNERQEKECKKRFKDPERITIAKEFTKNEILILPLESVKKFMINTSKNGLSQTLNLLLDSHQNAELAQKSES
mmetsp:Transcript_31811/g.28170  ORF Transcript_31811/g.28170 Transcript_31811/m.28170 type:complete len:229 (+) Transcript_31811:736-1422(+)